MAMELTSNNSNATVRSPDTDTDTSLPLSTTTKPFSFTNSALKRRPHRLRHHVPPASSDAAAGSYKECLKNHAASIGGHALDGCGEFMPSPSATAADPSSLTCAACHCHRNFHRRESHPPTPLPRRSSGSPSSPIPPQSPPPPSSYYSSAPQMLLALSAGGGNHQHEQHHQHQFDDGAAAARREESSGGGVRKRCRTRFSQDQKERMCRFADRLGWKMPKGGGIGDEGLVEEFCNEIGVSRGVLKVWMHNNKFTFGKRSKELVVGNGNESGIHIDSCRGVGIEANGHGAIMESSNIIHGDPNLETTVSANLHVSTNGSSSSS